MGDAGGGGKSAPYRNSSRPGPYRKEPTRQAPPADEKIENKLYVGNLDHRITEYHILKMFNPLGKIKREEFLWHTHGPRRGEPRGYAFVEYSTREEAEHARREMNGRPAFGRPLVVRFVDEKVVTYNNEAPVWARDGATGQAKAEAQGTAQTSVSKSAKIAAIQAKLRMMEQEDKTRGKKGEKGGGEGRGKGGGEGRGKGPHEPGIGGGESKHATGANTVPMSSVRSHDGGRESWNPPPPGSAGMGQSGQGEMQRSTHSRTLLPAGTRWQAPW